MNNTIHKLKSFSRNPYICTVTVFFFIAVILCILYVIFGDMDAEGRHREVFYFIDHLLYLYTLPAIPIILALYFLFGLGIDNIPFQIITIFVVTPLLYSLPIWGIIAIVQQVGSRKLKQ